jgi:uncharacterized membrane protein
MSAAKKKNIFNILQEEIASRKKEEERLSPAALLALPDNLRELMLRITRLGEVTPAQLVQELGQEEAKVKKMLSELVEKGYLREEKTYRVAFGRRRTTKLPQSIWESLEKKI